MRRRRRGGFAPGGAADLGQVLERIAALPDGAGGLVRPRHGGHDEPVAVGELWQVMEGVRSRRGSPDEPLGHHGESWRRKWELLWWCGLSDGLDWPLLGGHGEPVAAGELWQVREEEEEKEISSLGGCGCQILAASSLGHWGRIWGGKGPQKLSNSMQESQHFHAKCL